MDSQKDIFLASEANEWYNRNRAGYESSPDDFSILRYMNLLSIEPKRVLEIGCSNGIRLDEIQQHFKCEAYGIDPSQTAITDGKNKFSELQLSVGTAESLEYPDNNFDVLIFGFCLYLCDRKDLFTIAREADRCLKDQGFLIIKDFVPPIPYKNKYSHKEGIYSYKMNYSRMFSWNPSYNNIFDIVSSHSGHALRGIPDEKIGITILHKNELVAYPTEPYLNKKHA